jgi:hypothetical protein
MYLVVGVFDELFQGVVLECLRTRARYYGIFFLKWGIFVRVTIGEC